MVRVSRGGGGWVGGGQEVQGPHVIGAWHPDTRGVVTKCHWSPSRVNVVSMQLPVVINLALPRILCNAAINAMVTLHGCTRWKAKSFYNPGVSHEHIVTVY